MVVAMSEERVTAYDEPTAVYEIRLRGAPTASVRRQFPQAAVLTTRTETVLFRRVETPEELDELIAHLLSLGLVLNEVHEVPLAPPADRDAQGADTRAHAS
jgi:hypothetical protein